MVTINNPRLSESVGTLKYIGPYFRKRLINEGIKTLADLKDLIKSQTRAQNTRFLRRILENPRKLECVGTTRYHSESQKYHKYCVRRENQLAWYSIITYLKRKGVNARILPDAVQDRGNRERCANKNKCSTRNPVTLLPKRYQRIPYYPLEYVVIVMLNVENKNVFSGDDIWKHARRMVPLRNISASLSSNSGTKGKKLFQKAGKNRETNKTQYRFKSSVKRTLQNKTSQEILDYLRKL